MTQTMTKMMITINTTRKGMTTGMEVAAKAAEVAAAVVEAAAAAGTAEQEEKHMSAIMHQQGCTLCLDMELLLRQQAMLYSR